MKISQGVMKFKQGDSVKFPGFFMLGRVVRVARDGSWVDVDWGTWSKRQRLPSTLKLANS